MIKQLFLIVMLLISCSTVYAQSISGVSGTIEDGETVTISGSSFGAHADYNTGEDYLCALWTDFEDQDITADGNLGIANGFTDEWSIGTDLSRNGSSYHAVRDYVATRLAQLQFTQDSNSDGQLYSSYWFLPTTQSQTGKPWRWYWGSNSSRDNMFIGSSGTIGSTLLNATSESFQEPQETHFGDAWTEDDWQSIEILADYDGLTTSSTLKVFQDFEKKFNGQNPPVGQDSVDKGWWDETVAADSFDPNGRTIEIGFIDSDNTGNWYYDDWYIDFTQARVMIGDDQVFDDCTHKEVQIPLTWSSSSISVEFNAGSFPDEETVYLFVVDSDGTASSGYEITIGGSGPTPTPTPGLLLENITLTGGITIDL